MGKILPDYNKVIIEELVNSISSNTAQYYAFASNPIAISNNIPTIYEDDYTNYFINDWKMLFGKRLHEVDIVPIINKYIWESGVVYDMYDNTRIDQYTVYPRHYVITEPDVPGGTYDIFKCIDNANGAPSLIKPSLVQPSTFQTEPDNYKWRYITSITYKNYDKFATDDYVPVYANDTIVVSAKTYCGVDVVMISNGGINYATYTEGTILGISNNSLLQIDTNASGSNEFYKNSAIYIYNLNSATSQIFGIERYESNTSGNWVYLNGSANTASINSNLTRYKISPKVVFTSDGDSNPIGYSVVNSTANSIDKIIMLDSGSNITWSNVTISCNNFYGTGANLYAIVSPPGGHGSNPVSELNVKGLAVAFNFANTERGTIPTSNVLYNKVGIFKNPYYLNVNGTKGNSYYVNTFSQVLIANVTPSMSFSVEDTVVGNTSGALGVVVFSNSSQIHLVGDKYFEDGETIISSINGSSANISIQTLGDIYTKDIRPIYYTNINNTNRSNSQTEAFKLVIEF